MNKKMALDIIVSETLRQVVGTTDGTFFPERMNSAQRNISTSK